MAHMALSSLWRRSVSCRTVGIRCRRQGGRVASTGPCDWPHPRMACTRVGGSPRAATVSHPWHGMVRQLHSSSVVHLPLAAAGEGQGASVSSAATTTAARDASELSNAELGRLCSKEDLGEAWAYFCRLIDADKHNEASFILVMDMCKRIMTSPSVLQTLYSYARHLDVTLDLVGYRAVLESLDGSPVENMDSGIDILNDMLSRGLAPDELVFDRLVELCVRAGRTNNAIQLIRLMRQREVKVSTDLYESVLELIQEEAPTPTASVSPKPARPRHFGPDNMVEVGEGGRLHVIDAVDYEEGAAAAALPAITPSVLRDAGDGLSTEKQRLVVADLGDLQPEAEVAPTTRAVADASGVAPVLLQYLYDAVEHDIGCAASEVAAGASGLGIKPSLASMLNNAVLLALDSDDDFFDDSDSDPDDDSNRPLAPPF